ILSMAEYDDAIKVAKYIRKNYPRVKIFARAKDIYHTFEFFKANVTDVVPEVYYSATELGEKALVNLGFNKYEAYRSTRTFKHHEEEILEELYKHWREDHNEFIRESKRFSEQLSGTLKAEKNYSIHDSDCAWDADSLRSEAKKEN